MDTTLGKRKRRSQLSSTPPPSPSTTAHLHALFQQHFEAKYEPLPTLSPTLLTTTTSPSPRSSPSDSDDSAWEGLSPPTTPVPIITHSTPPRSKRADVPRAELRTFMVNPPSHPSTHPPKNSHPRQQKPAPPSTTPTPTPTPPSQKPPPAPSDPTDRALLANDLALQRLLAEAHLLQPPSLSSASSNATTPTLGLTTRHRALDLRIQALGAKQSLVGRQQVPLG
ncbi:hypothetical protein MMC32_008189, partial [Xylographa parallela]|nr:hypothetical protein [Xylographa parallela]